jgi:very-short-patch-repair endonuclease
MVDVLAALSQFGSCAAPELVAASADSILHRDPSTRSAIQAMAEELTPQYRRALLQVDGTCESGIETLFWLRMRRLSPRRQVQLAPSIRVDFVIGARLVIELDGEEFHSGALAFESDRQRDAALSARGYRVLRFSYRQVMFDWPSVEAAVRAAVARGDHY